MVRIAAEGITEPRPSSLPDSVLEDLSPKILLANYANDTTEEIIKDLCGFLAIDRQLVMHES